MLSAIFLERKAKGPYKGFEIGNDQVEVSHTEDYHFIFWFIEADQAGMWNENGTICFHKV